MMISLMKYKIASRFLLIFIFLLFLAGVVFPAEQEEKPLVKENRESAFPLLYSPKIKTTYIDINSQEVVGKSEVRRGEILFFNKKGGLERTGAIRGDTVLYDKGDVKREKIAGNKIYQYDKDGKLVGKIWVRPDEIKKILPDGNVEKLKIKINR